MAKISIPEFGLSLQWISADARQIDWSDASGENVDGYELQLPDPTYGDWSDHSSSAPADVERIAKRTPRKALSDEHAEAFRETDSYYEWSDGFAPMMNYAWPVTLAYKADLAATIRAMAEHARACTLIQLSEEMRALYFGDSSDAPEFVIALSGGGMDLSDHIAAAYLCCGCVPPSRILSGLAGVISKEKARRLPLRQAYRAAAEHFAFKAKSMRAQAKRVFSVER